MSAKTNSIGINSWIGEADAEVIISSGSGDSQITAWMRDDGSVAIETNGDPIFGDEAESCLAEMLKEQSVIK